MIKRVGVWVSDPGCVVGVGGREGSDVGVGIVVGVVRVDEGNGLGFGVTINVGLGVGTGAEICNGDGMLKGAG